MYALAKWQSEVNQLKAQVMQMQMAHENQVTQMQMAHEKQESETTEMRKLIVMLMEGNAHRNNAPSIIPNTTSLLGHIRG